MRNHFLELCSNPRSQLFRFWLRRFFPPRRRTKFRVWNALTDRSRRAVSDILYYSKRFHWCSQERTLNNWSVAVTRAAWTEFIILNLFESWQTLSTQFVKLNSASMSTGTPPTDEEMSFVKLISNFTASNRTANLHKFHLHSVVFEKHQRAVLHSLYCFSPLWHSEQAE